MNPTVDVVKSKTCPRCNHIYPHSSDFFYRNRRKPSGLDGYCKTCSLSRKAERKKNGICRDCSAPIEHGYANCERCRQAGSGRSGKRMLLLAQTGECLSCKGATGRLHSRCEQCAERIRQYHTAKRRRLLEEILTYYGKLCACCGESELMFLTIDHINNDGASQRRMNGHRDYSRIRKTWPSDLQILCYNCNMGKARNGGRCPHVYV